MWLLRTRRRGGRRCLGRSGWDCGEGNLRERFVLVSNELRNCCFPTVSHHNAYFPSNVRSLDSRGQATKDKISNHALYSHICRKSGSLQPILVTSGNLEDYLR